LEKLTYQEVRVTCNLGRFFSYDNWRDRLFVPPAIFLVWIFYRLRMSGNLVSYLSGFAALLGGMLLAANDSSLILIGSFGYMLFYFLDYVDGGVARLNKKSGIGGQYVDWVMHVLASVGTACGLAIGAYAVAGNAMIPFGVLFVVAAALNLDRYSFAWFSICMYRQQRAVKGEQDLRYDAGFRPFKRNSLMNRMFNGASILLFHENNAIFLLPLLALLNLYIEKPILDFRVWLTVLGSVIFLPATLIDIWELAENGRIDQSYEELFSDSHVPVLPEEHFFQKNE
jgi:phosphatidylglycerophosphate synthase